MRARAQTGFADSSFARLPSRRHSAIIFLSQPAVDSLGKKLGGLSMTGLIPQSPSSSLLPSPAINVLLIDSEDVTARFAPFLRSTYRVAVSSSIAMARDFLRRSSADLIVLELQLRDGNGADVCREAKALSTPPAVLATTDSVESAPDALAAGCDGVLLKPFAPNLLCARVGRLLRERSIALRHRSENVSGKSQHLLERSSLLLQGTNRVWPNTHCPHCQQSGVTSFEFTSHRRAWYACLECRKVWIAPRRE